jgi:hypothetical protein
MVSEAGGYPGYRLGCRRLGKVGTLFSPPQFHVGFFLLE